LQLGLKRETPRQHWIAKLEVTSEICYQDTAIDLSRQAFLRQTKCNGYTQRMNIALFSHWNASNDIMHLLSLAVKIRSKSVETHNFLQNRSRQPE
jgi:hypothetical protein